MLGCEETAEEVKCERMVDRPMMEMEMNVSTVFRTSCGDSELQPTVCLHQNLVSSQTQVCLHQNLYSEVRESCRTDSFKQFLSTISFLVHYHRS